MTSGSYDNGYYQFSDGLRVEHTTVTLRGGVKLQAPSLLPAPLPKALQSPKMTTPLVAQGKERAAEHRALHYDDHDCSQRELRVLRDDRRLRRLLRQESLLQWYVIVCVTIITTVWRRKRD